MTILFDSARLVHPLCHTGRSFAVGLDQAPAVEPILWPEFHGPGRNPAWPTDADDPDDYAPAFHPSPEEDQWAAETSPLNRTDDEAAALNALYAEIERPSEWLECFPADPSSWSEYDALVNDNGQFGHTRETA